MKPACNNQEAVINGRSIPSSEVSIEKLVPSSEERLRISIPTIEEPLLNSIPNTKESCKISPASNQTPTGTSKATVDISDAALCNATVGQSLVCAVGEPLVVDAASAAPGAEAGRDRIALDLLPPAPQEPHASDCCGTGCRPCVFDIYEQELKLWKTRCHLRTHDVHATTQSNGVISIDSYKPFELIHISRETSESSRYHFALPGQQCLPLSVGQHLIMRWTKVEGTITRQYTPITAAMDRGFFDIVIKLYADGEMSAYIRTWKVGDLVDWRGPCGDFTYIPNSHMRLLMLSAGTGIAPMMQVTGAILDNESDETRVTLLFCCRTYSDILCKEQLDQWTDFWNFSVVYYLSQDSVPGQRVKYRDKVVYSRLTEEHLRKYITDDCGVSNTRVLLCGTKSFEKDMINYANQLGFEESDVFRF